VSETGHAGRSVLDETAASRREEKPAARDSERRRVPCS
jgi:hypothetical protein